MAVEYSFAAVDLSWQLSGSFFFVVSIVTERYFNSVIYSLWGFKYEATEKKQ
jgi:hypothetical protein